MRLSADVHSLTKRFGERKAICLAKDAGFDCIDYSFFLLDDDLKEQLLGDGYVEHAKELRSYLDEIGMVCNQAHSPFGFTILDGRMDMTNENYRNTVRAIESAAILGAENIVVHALRPEESGKSVLELNYEYYKSLEPYLEKFKIHLAIENLFGEPYDEVTKKYTRNRFDRPEKMWEILKRLDSEWFVCCVDVGHAAITGIDPQEYIKGMDNTVLKALHIHDNDYERDRHRLPYTGKLNWDEITKSLRQIGYNGDMTFEMSSYFEHFDEELIPDALKLAERIGRHLISKCL